MPVHLAAIVIVKHGFGVTSEWRVLDGLAVAFAHMQRALREVENGCGAQRRCGLMADVYVTEQTTLNAAATFHEGGQSNRWFDAKALGSMVAGKSDSNVARRTELRGTRQ